MKKSIEIINNNGDDLNFEYENGESVSIVLNKDILVGILNCDEIIELIRFLSQFLDGENK